MSGVARPLEGRVVVVTGGNGGIGLGMARGLVDAGASVAIWGRNEAKTEAARDELQARAGESASVIGLRCDVADEGDVLAAFARTVDELGGVDSLFANAGIPGRTAPVAELTLDDWREVLAVNLDGAFLCLREAARHFIDRGRGGSLVAVASTAAYHGAARKAHYGAGKAALLGLVRAMAVELARYGVRVNALVPGWTDTELAGPEAGFGKENHERFVEITVRRTPVRRWAAPDDFAAAAVYLADPAMTFHTGDALVIDGGYTIF